MFFLFHTTPKQIAWLMLWAVAAYGWGVARSPVYIRIGDVVFHDPAETCIQDLSKFFSPLRVGVGVGYVCLYIYGGVYPGPE